MDRERIVQMLFFGLLAAMAYELYQLLLPFMMPIAWGVLLAFMAQPALVELEKYVKRRSTAALIISVAVGLGVVLPAVWLSGKLVGEAHTLYASVSAQMEGGGLTKLEDWVTHSDSFGWIADRMAAQGYKIGEQIPKLTMESAQAVSDYVIANVTQAARNLLTFVIDFGIALVVFFYMLRDGASYLEAIRNLAPLREEDKIELFHTLGATLSSVMRGMLLTAVLQGITIGLGLLVFGVPYWIFLSIATMAAGLMPIGGTALIWIPASLYLLYASGWPAAIGLAIWGTTAVAIIDNFIKPMAMKQGTDLPTLALFLGIFGGLEVYGPIGLFAGPAIMSVFVTLLRVYRKTYVGARKEAV
ncbi:MAG TPA: AI-2E family transporter [Candidatus Binataceae bacterium]|nr:AI-2E family transporter [Candidatus Binataceae bacterium]